MKILTYPFGWLCIQCGPNEVLHIKLVKLVKLPVHRLTPSSVAVLDMKVTLAFSSVYPQYLEQ